MGDAQAALDLLPVGVTHISDDGTMLLVNRMLCTMAGRSADDLPGGTGQALTRNQHRERLAATFSRQDGNGDGYLSARELAAPPQ